MSDSSADEGFTSPEQKKKKKRSANFTPNETILLMGLVSDLKHIIENKKTDGVSMQEKVGAWKKITNSFNSSCPEGRHRTMESLKKLYDNKKREVRKQKADEKKHILLTGGGPPRPDNDPAKELILSIVDPLTVVGGESRYGSDSLPFPKPRDNTNESDEYFTFEFEPENVQCIENILNTQEASTVDLLINNDTKTTKPNWKKGSDLATPIATPLKRNMSEAHVSQGVNGQLKHNEKSCNNENIHSQNIENKQSNNKNKNIQCRPLNRRRPTETVVRSLASNQLCEKYDQLADKKNAIADYTLKKIKLDIEFSKQEHELKMQSLQLDIDLKKKQLEAFRSR